MASIKKKKNARGSKKITKKEKGLKTPKLYDTTYSLNMNEEADCRTAVHIYPLNIIKTNRKFRENPDNYVPLIKKDPYVLFDAPDSVKNNEKLAEMAVRKDVWTARAVSPNIYGLDSFMREASESDELKRWGKDKYATEDSDEKIRRVISNILMMEHDAELRMDTSAIENETGKQDSVSQPAVSDGSKSKNAEAATRESVRHSEIPKVRTSIKPRYVTKESSPSVEDDEFGKLVEMINDDIKK